MLVMSLAVFATSCLNDNYTDFSKVSPVLEFPDAIPGGSTALDLTDSIVTIRVDITGAYAPSKDVVVNIGSGGSNGLVMYNKDTTHVVGILAPDNAYTLPSTITIKAGKDSLGNDNRTAEFKLMIHPKNIPNTPGANYVIPVAITGGPAGTIVSGNFGYILFNFYKNIWDGNYKRTGNLHYQTGPGAYTDIAIAETDALTTVNATTSHSFVSYFGPSSGITYYVVVKPDNSVIFVADSNSAYAVSNVSGQPSSYDPNTQTFTMNYTYTNASGNTRVFTETWVKQ